MPSDKDSFSCLHLKFHVPDFKQEGYSDHSPSKAVKLTSVLSKHRHIASLNYLKALRFLSIHRKS